MATKVKVAKKAIELSGTKPKAKWPVLDSHVTILSPEDRNGLDRITGMSVDEDKLMMARRSEITTCEACPRRALLGYQYGLRTTHRAPGRDQSSYGHLTVALLLRGMQPLDVASLLDKMMQDVAASGRDPTNVDRAQDVSLGFACGCYIHDKLVDHVQGKGFKVRNVEEKFSGEMAVDHQYLGVSVRIPFRFQTDFILETKDGELYLWDTKIIGTSSELYSIQAQLSLQSALYVMWARMVPSLGKRVRGIIYGVCGKPSCSRKGLTKGEGQDLNDYVKECYENLEGVGRWAKMAEKRETEKAMQVVSKIPSAEEMVLATHRLVECHMRKVRGRNNLSFPPHDDCVNGYMKCDFLQLCRYDQNQWKRILSDPLGVFTAGRDPLDSERIHCSELKPVKILDAVVVPVLPTEDMFEKKKDRGMMTTKWRMSTL